MRALQAYGPPTNQNEQAASAASAASKASAASAASSKLQKRVNPNLLRSKRTEDRKLVRHDKAQLSVVRTLCLHLQASN